jgi:protein-S-isoprenylcysteine O-methyltransferase Ste14
MPPCWLPLLLGSGALAALAAHSLRMRQSGVNPWVLPTGDDAHGFLGRALVVLTASYVFVLLMWALGQGWSLRALGAVPLLLNPVAAWMGIVAMAVGVILIVGAQRAMGLAWRIGIPAKDTPTLITTGPFRVSRNPVFLGILLVAIGIVLAIPNSLALAALGATYIALSVQIRLEESYLEGWLGSSYLDYAARVNRWVTFPRVFSRNSAR